jgi:hypothetical protein
VSESVDEANLLFIEARCLGAAFEGGERWQRFMADAERRMGMPWSAIKDLLNERYADRKRAAA